MFYGNLKLFSGPMYDSDFGRDPHIESIRFSTGVGISTLRVKEIQINSLKIKNKYTVYSKST